MGELHSARQSVVPAVSSLDLRSVYVALFALGDQRYHRHTFGGALKHLHFTFADTGATLVGTTMCQEYQFTHCPALARDGMLPGLLLDEISQRRLSPQRIEKWVKSVYDEINGQRLPLQMTSLQD